MKCMNLLACCFEQWKAEHVDRRPGCFASDAEVAGEPTWRGMGILEAKRWMVMFGAILAMGTVTNANAGLFGLGGTNWKEEILLHDGQKIIVERTLERGGRHEIGQRPSYTKQTLVFTHPTTGEQVTWEDNTSSDLGNSSFLPMTLDIYQSTIYLVANPMGCLAYNKWGRPNPPYVVFRYETKTWERVPLQELPQETKALNMIFSSPDTEIERIGKRFVDAATIRWINTGYSQPEYKTIVREAVENPADRCGEMISDGQGRWIGMGWFRDQPTREACLNYCVREKVGPENCPCETLFKDAK